MDGVPKPGQWFHVLFPPGKWLGTYKAKGRYIGMTNAKWLLAVEHASSRCRTISIPITQYTQFEIITDPEEEALLALAYM